MRRILGLVGMGMAMAVGPAAHATLQVFTIDPTLSVVSATGSELSVDLGGLIGVVTIPLQSQVGNVTGVGGFALPDGSVSDGLRTALGGQLLVDRTPGAIQFRTQITSIVPVNSGTWRPGLPVDPQRSAAAQLGGFLADSSLGFNARIAIRNAAFVYSSPAPLVLAASGGGFDFDAAQLFRLSAGVLDVDSSLAYLEGSDPLVELSASNAATGGRLDPLAGTFERLTIPVDLEFLLGSEFFDGLPFSATVRLAGQIVATRGQIPEPSTALLLGGGAALLGARRRSWRRRQSSRSGGRACLLLAGLVLLVACSCLRTVSREDCDNGIDDDRNGATDCEDIVCAEMSECVVGEICNDGEDNDFDGATDCEDTEECCGDASCEVAPVCTTESDCQNEVDDEGDGFTDCSDPDCDLEPLCNLGTAPVESISCLDQSGFVLILSTFDQAVDTSGCADTARVDTDPTGLTGISVEHHAEVVDDAATGEREVALVCTHRRDQGPYAGIVQCRSTVHVAVAYGPGGDHVFLGTRSDRFGLVGIGSGSATWTCAGQTGEIFPFEGVSVVPVSPLGGVCTVELEIGCSASGRGATGGCRDSLYVRADSGVCSRDSECAPGEQCGPLGCQLGRSNDLCSDNEDCESSAGFFCNSFGLCSDGSTGSSCAQEIAEWECDSATCDDDGICRTELCGNGVDDNGDEAVDCDDAECSGAGACPLGS